MQILYRVDEDENGFSAAVSAVSMNNVQMYVVHLWVNSADGNATSHWLWTVVASSIPVRRINGVDI